MRRLALVDAIAFAVLALILGWAAFHAVLHRSEQAVCQTLAVSCQTTPAVRP